MRPPTSIKLRIGASFGVALLVIAIGWVGAGSLSAAMDMQLKARHARAVGDAGRQLLQALLEEESGVRGYLVTRDERRLLAHRANGEAALLGPLRTLLAGDPSAMAHVDAMEQDVRTWHAQLAEMVAMPADPTSIRVRDDDAQRRMARIREQIGVINAAQELVRARNVADHRSTVIFARAVILGGTLLAFSLAVVVNVSLSRAVRERDAGVKIVEQQAARLAEYTQRLVQHERELGAQLEREQALSTALQRSNEELDQFAYATSHDLRAPLRGIMNIASWVEGDLGQTASEDVRHNLALLRGRARRLEALIEGILAYSRAGRVQAKAERVETLALVTEVSELIAPPGEVRVRALGEWPTLLTERVPLQQVLMNLLQNAIKHGCPDGSGAVEVVAARAASGEPRFEVIDHGAGIAPEFHQRIFGLFQMLRSRDQIEGTGIGLAVVKKIVETRGGELGVESEKGAGARFWFTWPEEPQPAERELT